DGMRNPKLETGDVEVIASSTEILGECPPLPFNPDSGDQVNDELRFRYRFIDMRREEIQRRFRLRSDMQFAMRQYLHGHDFLDLETPMLTKSTPEGARDFLVPSRQNPGEFYALPQSPQIFKQIFMISGFDRYMQVVRCFRDEDLRADRQPEFTQLDLEMACIDESDIMGLVEGLMEHVVKEVTGKEVTLPFPRLSYKEAMLAYGSDSPDMRSDLRIQEFSDLVEGLEFKVFSGAVESGGAVRGMRIPGGGQWSRKEIESLEPIVKQQGAGGLAWFKMTDDGPAGPVSRFLAGAAGEELIQRLGMEPGDLACFVADKQTRVVVNSMGQLRKELAIKLGHIEPGVLNFCWVEEFPLFDEDEETGQPTPCHHPFTCPHPDDLSNLESKPLEVRARAYDLVLNGFEVGGGSIRIHQRELQERVFTAIGITAEEAESKFSFLLEALRFGAPPHGGIALGMDRLAMILAGLETIREVIAFPKTQRGTCQLTNAPDPVTTDQLSEVGLMKEPVVEEEPVAEEESGQDS
ncbi:MAG: aspartate--tRNA ligase, partial [Proteobacteria bacterium]|nr:aspartate--tRNA ligase [Pseudomonadota bacterium]